MSKPERIHITGTRGEWAGKKENAERASFRTETKQEAIDKGRDMAKKVGGELIIHGENGKIQEERTYGNDPYPPKG